MMFIRATTVLLVAFLFVACSSAAPSALINRQWQLIEIRDQPPIAAGQPVTIQFDPTDRVSGFAGCNGFSGQYRVAGATITVSKVISTMMACADDAVTAQEMAFHQALSDATRYELTAGILSLLDRNGVVVLRFQAA